MKNKKLLILICFLLYSILEISTKTVTQYKDPFIYDCNASNCPKGQGKCTKKKECKCYPYFATSTIGNDNPHIYCNRQQKSRWIAFVLELLLPSVGHFYSSRLFYGFIKLGLLIFPLVVFALGFCCKEKPNLNESREVAPDLTGKDIIPHTIAIIGVIAFMLFYITDLVLYGIHYYYDGYGVPLY